MIQELQTYMTRKLLVLDLLAPEVKFNIEGKRSVRTRVGACLTILYFVTMVLAAVFIFKTYLRTDTPSSMSETFHLPNYPRVDLVEQRLLPIVFGYVGDEQSIFADDFARFVTLSVSKQTWYSAIDEFGEAVTKLKETFFDVIACKHLTPEELSMYEYFGKDSYLFQMISDYGMCIKPSPELFVQGKGSDELFESVALRIKPCSLDTGCAVTSVVEQLNFYITLPQTSFDQTNLEHPYAVTVNADALYYINPKAVQLYNARIKFNRVMDFIGVMPKWTERKSYFDIKEVFYNVASRLESQTTCPSSQVKDNSQCSSYLELTLQSSGSVMRINRRYKTLSETCGELGGIKEVLLLIFLLCYYRYSLQARDEYLIENVYGDLDQFQRLSQEKAVHINKSEQPTGRDARPIGMFDSKSNGQPSKDAFKKLAIENIRSNLNVLNIIKEMNNLKVICMFLFRSHHYKLSPVLQLNLSRRSQQERAEVESFISSRRKQPSRDQMLNAQANGGSSLPQGLLEVNKSKLIEVNDCFDQLTQKVRSSGEAGTDSLEHQLDLFFYKCMKETDEYIHKKI